MSQMEKMISVIQILHSAHVAAGFGLGGPSVNRRIADILHGAIGHGSEITQQAMFSPATTDRGTQAGKAEMGQTGMTPWSLWGGYGNGHGRLLVFADLQVRCEECWQDAIHHSNELIS